MGRIILTDGEPTRGPIGFELSPGLTRQALGYLKDMLEHSARLQRLMDLRQSVLGHIGTFEGARIGTTLHVRKPARFVTGASISPGVSVSDSLVDG